MQFLAPIVCASALSAAVCYPLVRFSGRLCLQAQPRPDRWHASATPNTGGVAVTIAAAVCYLVFAPAGFGRLALCAAAIALLGFVDDRLELPPLAKLVGQMIPALLFVTGGGIVVLTPWTAVNAAITMAWLIGVTNAFNLIDNMDGLCGGVAAMVALSGAALALLKGDGPRAIILAVIAGACAGFLLFNLKPAQIFLGDCGSLFLGFTLAALAIVPAHPAPRLLEGAYALPAFLYPLFDSAFVSVLRRRSGRPIYVGGRDHSSHRLVAAGMSERNAVWSLWVIAGGCAACGPLTYLHDGWLIPVFACLLALLAIFGGFLSRVPAAALTAGVARRHGQLCPSPANRQE